MAHELAHGSSVREMSPESISTPTGEGDPGKFGRMFPGLPPLEVPEAKLVALAAAMKEATPGAPGGDNPNVPAGYTYLGQFIDHDITLDTTPIDQQHADPLAIRNFRSPAVDLDSLYGQGPNVSPELYARDAATLRMLPELLVGTASKSPGPGGEIPALPNDLPRNAVGRAVIGDERNDENLLVAQTHLLFIKFHNAVVAHLRATQPALAGGKLFDEARRIVTWHYQWIVLFDFVERLTEPGLVNRIRQQGRRFYRFRDTPYMPVEFAAAAYRLGHSMVREVYGHNRVFRPGGAPGETFGAATLGLLFFFTGKSGGIVGDLVDDPAVGPSPNPALPLQRTLPSNWVIDWRRFYDLGTPAATPNFRLNAARRIDPFLVPELHTLPGGGGVLPLRNLKRGVLLGLPSGQDVAHAMGVETLTPLQLTAGEDGKVLQEQGLVDATPLWYYILKEAEQFHDGLRLGPVGSTIIAETFLGMVHGDHDSFLWQRSNWTPELPSQTPGEFTMVDMLRFVDDINPIG
jgi:hypothetical protein